MKTKLLVLSIAALCLSAAPAMGGPGGPPGPALQAVLDGITIPPPSSVIVGTDYIPDLADTAWHIAGGGASAATFIISLTGNPVSNVFGLYDLGGVFPNIPVPFIGGQAMVSVQSTGQVIINLGFSPGGNITGTWFGWYLDSGPQGGVYYSDSTLNPGSLDHMYAYQGTGVDEIQIAGWGQGTWTPNEYILAFEDKMDAPGGVIDWDYDDYVVLVESVYVPVPGAILLGILGLSVAGIKLRKYA